MSNAAPVRQALLLFYAVYFMFAAALNAIILPVWAAGSNVVIGVVMILTGAMLAAFVCALVLVAKKQRRQQSEIVPQGADVQHPQEAGVCEYHEGSAAGD